MSDPGREPDYRMQQELEEERVACIFTLLDKVACGKTTLKDADELARELGLSNEWRKYVG